MSEVPPGGVETKKDVRDSATGPQRGSSSAPPVSAEEMKKISGASDEAFENSSEEFAENLEKRGAKLSPEETEKLKRMIDAQGYMLKESRPDATENAEEEATETLQELADENGTRPAGAKAQKDGAEEKPEDEEQKSILQRFLEVIGLASADDPRGDEKITTEEKKVDEDRRSEEERGKGLLAGEESVVGLAPKEKSETDSDEAGGWAYDSDTDESIPASETRNAKLAELGKKFGKIMDSHSEDAFDLLPTGPCGYPSPKTNKRKKAPGKSEGGPKPGSPPDGAAKAETTASAPKAGSWDPRELRNAMAENLEKNLDEFEAGMEDSEGENFRFPKEFADKLDEDYQLLAKMGEDCGFDPEKNKDEPWAQSMNRLKMLADKHRHPIA